MHRDPVISGYSLLRSRKRVTERRARGAPTRAHSVRAPAGEHGYDRGSCLMGPHPGLSAPAHASGAAVSTSADHATRHPASPMERSSLLRRKPGPAPTGGLSVLPPHGLMIFLTSLVGGLLKSSILRMSGAWRPVTFLQPGGRTAGGGETGNHQAREERT